MNELQVFNHPEFGEIGVIEIDGRPYFPASICATTLGYSNPRDAISRHCRGVVKHDGVSLTTNQHGASTEQTISMNFIPEGDLYRLIVKSQLPAAEKFERWVFDEVLPSIRKHGAYMTPQTLHEALSDPRNMAQLLNTLADEQERSRALQAQIEADAPLVLFSKSVTVSDDAVLIRELSKILKGNGIDMGQNCLFAWLRENGYLIKAKGDDYNTPTQRAMELGLFKIKETVVNCGDGTIFTKPTPMVTGKGQVYFVNKFLTGDARKAA